MGKAKKQRIAIELTPVTNTNGNGKPIIIKDNFKNKFGVDLNAKVKYGPKKKAWIEGCSFIIKADTPQTTEKTPVAIVLNNNIVVEEDRQQVILDASQSFIQNNDPVNPSTLTFRWEQTKGNPVLDFTEDELKSPILKFNFAKEYDNLQFKVTVKLEQDGKTDSELVNVIDNIDVETPPEGVFDANGVRILDKEVKALSGYLFKERVTDVNEFIYKLNDNDSHRFQYEAEHFVNQNIGAYVVVPDIPDKEEISALLKGGHSNDSNPDDSRSYHVGVSADGKRIRIRKESKQNTYNDWIEKTVNLGDLRGKTVGFDFYALNKSNNGNNIAVQILVFVDLGGLDSGGKPLNQWQLVLNEVDVNDPYFDSFRGDADHIIGLRIDSTTTKPEISGLHVSNMVADVDVQVPTECPDGFHLENGVCVPDVIPQPTGSIQFEKDGQIFELKLSGRKIEMEHGSEHRNGKRFNCNVPYLNYAVLGNFKMGTGQVQIEMKTDGPNHGEDAIAKVAPYGLWYEPGIYATGKAKMGTEVIHANNYTVPLENVQYHKDLDYSIDGQWIKYLVAAWTDPITKKRHVLEAATKALQNPPTAVIHLQDNEDGKIFPKVVDGVTIYPRDLQKVIDRNSHKGGLELEIRMHKAAENTTEMDGCWAYELIPVSIPTNP